jgi:hypothetical protein
MSEVTTIQLDKKIVRELKDAKEYPEQTYSALLQKLIILFKRVKERDQYDKFLHTIQQQKMRELWDNKADEAWEHA